MAQLPCVSIRLRAQGALPCELESCSSRIASEAGRTLSGIERSTRMIVCEFCSYYLQDNECRLGLKIPKGMSCNGFGPALEKFCSDPKDFVNLNQIVQMATFFGMKGMELKKVKLMATKEESTRS